MILLAEEMSDDETLALVVGILLTGFGLYRWYWPLITVTSLARSARQRLLLALSPVACMLILLPALSTFTAVEVRTDTQYIVLFAFVGGAWLAVHHMLMPWLGMHPRDDAIERGNTAVAVAIVGAQVGLILTYTGANLGEGPTIWTTIGPALIAAGGLVVLWIIVELAADSSESICIDRDLASGVRHAGMSIACGLILGRAVTGDWESSDATWHDFFIGGWPALAIVVGAVVVHHLFKPTPRWPKPGVFVSGVAPAAIYLAAAVAWVAARGDWRSPVVVPQ